MHLILLFYNIISELRVRKRQQPRPEIGHCIDLLGVREKVLCNYLALS